MFPLLSISVLTYTLPVLENKQEKPSKKTRQFSFSSHSFVSIHNFISPSSRMEQANPGIKNMDYKKKVTNTRMVNYATS